eukprot:3480259-Ditylum_brightwellii.AAC.1
MAALNISWKKKEGRTTCLLLSNPDNVMTGCHYNTIRGVEKFELSESAYADDAAFLFSSHAVTEQETPTSNNTALIGAWKFTQVLLPLPSQKERLPNPRYFSSPSHLALIWIHPHMTTQTYLQCLFIKENTSLL